MESPGGWEEVSSEDQADRLEAPLLETGAKAALLSAAAMAEAERLAKAVKNIELSARKDFQDAFMEKMMFS